MTVDILYNRADPQEVKSAETPPWWLFPVIAVGLVIVFGGCAWLFGFLAGDWRWPLRKRAGLRR